jgi:hemerythrin
MAEMYENAKKEIENRKKKKKVDEEAFAFVLNELGEKEEEEEEENAEVVLSETLQCVVQLVIAMFSVFADEEKLIKKLRLAEVHRRAHFSGHASFLRKLQNLSLQIAASEKKKKKSSNSSPEIHVTNIVQLISSYLTDHVAKIDREFIALLRLFRFFLSLYFFL